MLIPERGVFRRSLVQYNIDCRRDSWRLEEGCLGSSNDWTQSGNKKYSNPISRVRVPTSFERVYYIKRALTYLISYHSNGKLTYFTYLASTHIDGKTCVCQKRYFDSLFAYQKKLPLCMLLYGDANEEDDVVSNKKKKDQGTNKNNGLPHIALFFPSSFFSIKVCSICAPVFVSVDVQDAKIVADSQSTSLNHVTSFSLFSSYFFPFYSFQLKHVPRCTCVRIYIYIIYIYI